MLTLLTFLRSIFEAYSVAVLAKASLLLLTAQCSVVGLLRFYCITNCQASETRQRNAGFEQRFCKKVTLEIDVAVIYAGMREYAETRVPMH